MQVKTPDGRVITAAPGSESYYRREPDYQVLSDAVPAVADVESVVEPSEGDEVQRPAESASKRDWYDYAAKIDPDLVAYEDVTQQQLVDKYGE